MFYIHLFCSQVGEAAVVNGKEPGGRKKFQLLERIGDKRGEKGVEVPKMEARKESTGGDIISTGTGRKELGIQRGELKSKLCPY